MFVELKAAKGTDIPPIPPEFSFWIPSLDLF